MLYADTGAPASTYRRNKNRVHVVFCSRVTGAPDQNHQLLGAGPVPRAVPQPLVAQALVVVVGPWLATPWAEVEVGR